MQAALAEKMRRLINAELDRQGVARLAVPNRASDEEILKASSQQIITRNLLQRDLVITGSCLDKTSESLPSDLYFYSRASGSGLEPQFGPRGISLAQRPAILLDVILGSGSIFPVFPGRVIQGVPAAGDQIELVDGGFAHNSPLEAAVLWGATHIFLIEAVAPRESKRGNFTHNIAASFVHLHRQAQLLDARTRGRITIFSLRPEPPHICVLDFASNLIRAAIDRGYGDARMTHENGEPRFRKEPGAPAFIEIEP
jgi:hypothetical protein